MRVTPTSIPSFRLPTVKGTTSLAFERLPDVSYIPEYQVFRLHDVSDSSYYIHYNEYNFSNALLCSKEAGETDPAYLQVPDGLDRLRELAEFVTLDSLPSC